MNGNELLFNGLETVTDNVRFLAIKNLVSEAAFIDVFLAQWQERLVWRRLKSEPNDFYTQVSVKNARGETVTAPVFLLTRHEDNDCTLQYLMLGSTEEGPCRNCFDPRVKQLYEQVTEKSKVTA